MGVLNVAVNIVAYDLTGGAIRAMVGDLNALGQQGTRAMLGVNQAGQDAAITMLTLQGAAIGAGLAFAAFAGATSAGISGAGDLQMGLQRLENATQSTAGAFPKLEQAVIDMATHSLYSTQDTTAAFEKLSEMGFQAQTVMYGFGPAAQTLYNGAYNSSAAMQGLSRQALAVGEAMQVGAVEGATLLGSALNTFKSEGLSAADAANILTGAFYNGVPKASDLQYAIEQAGGTASSSGVKLQDFATTLDLLAQAGLSGSSAGASLAYMLRSLDNPTTKQAATMAELGITTVNSGAALSKFTDQLAASGAAGATAVQGFDGSVTGLQALYKAGQAANLIPLDESFNLWATSAGVLSNKLFDAQGNFIGFKGALDVLDSTMGAKSLTMQEKMQIIGDLFNVRSGRAALLLTNLGQFDQQYQTIWDRIGKTNALDNANKMLATFNGAITTLKTTLSSALAEAFLPVVAFLAKAAQGVNDFVSSLLKADPWVKTLLASFLIFGTILAGVFTVAIVGVLIALSPFAPLVAGIAAAFALAVIGAIQAAAWFTLIATHAQQLHAFLKPVLDDISSFASGLMERLGPALGTITTVLGAFLSFLVSRWQSAWQTLGPIVGLVWNAIVTALRIAGALIQGIIFVLLDIIGGKWGQAWNDIKQVGINIWSAISDGVRNMVGLLGSLWNGLVTTLQNAWNTIAHANQAAMQAVHDTFWSAWNNIVSFIGMVINTIITVIGAGMRVVQTNISNAWNTALSVVKSIIGAILTAVVGGFASVVGAVGSAMSSFTSAISGEVGAAASAIGSVLTAIKNAVMGLIGQAAGWGADIVKNIAGGITGGGGLIGAAAGGIAGLIKGVLGHSKPETGPMADDDTWMPDMMLGFARDIENYTPTIARAASGVASAIQGSINTPQLSSLGGSLAIAGSGGDTTVNLNVDGKTLYQATFNRATGRLKQAGGARQFR